MSLLPSSPTQPPRQPDSARRAGAPAERMPLLEAERREDREQVHRNATGAIRLSAQLLAIAVLLERFGIRERLDVLHVAAVDDVPHGKLDDLAALGARDV